MTGRNSFELSLGMLVILLVVGLSACSPLTVINGVSPSSQYERMKGEAYGDEERQSLDVYLPRHARKATPAVVFFYGGGWDSGAKEKYEFVASTLTRSGVAVIVPDYRLYPDVTFPAFIEDAASAVAWSINNASRLNIDTGQVFVMGHSAGAYIAAMLALDSRYLSGAGLTTEVFAGLIGLSGPYDFLPLQSPRLKSIFPEDTRSISQPVDFVTASAPPTLLIHGNSDSTVYLKNSENLAEELRKTGTEVELKIYNGVGHARVVAALAPPLNFIAKTREDTVSFIERLVTTP